MCIRDSALFIQKLMHKFDLPAKVIARRTSFVVYLKAADKIADFLRCAGAYEALMKFEDIRKMCIRDRHFQLDSRIGSLKPGKQADLIVIDKEFHVLETIVQGRTVYRQNDKIERNPAITDLKIG